MASRQTLTRKDSGGLVSSGEIAISALQKLGFQYVLFFFIENEQDLYKNKYETQFPGQKLLQFEAFLYKS